MANSEQKRQKQLMKKRRKEKQRKKIQHVAVPFSSMTPRQVIKEARRFPIYECRVNDNWQEEGIANVIIARTQPNGNIVFGVYLVDIFCLGVKSSFANAAFTLAEYRSRIIEESNRKLNMIECAPALAHSIVYGGIDFAAQFGFKPDKDFALTQYVLEERDKLEPVPVTFGKNGKPFFIAGPHDNSGAILRQLAAKAGEGNFDYLTEIAPGERLGGYDREDLAEDEGLGIEFDRPDWDPDMEDDEALEEKMAEWNARDWPAWLNDHLAFPFQAIRREDLLADSTAPAPEADLFGVGHLMDVEELAKEEDADLGLLANVREKDAAGRVPLVELEVMPPEDRNYWPLREYRVWMDNR